MADGVLSALNAAGGAVPQTAAAQRSEKLNERFLTLLVAQMQNQMPLKPMDSSQVTSQIAQINTVSGINKLNDTLSAITAQLDTTQRLQATSLIGHKVLVPGNKISVGPSDDGVGTAATPYGVELAQPARKVQITIINKLGETVREFTRTNEPAGIHAYTWNGLNAMGDPVNPQGSYTVLIDAVGVDGNAIAAQPLSMAVVNGVVASENGPKLDLGPNGMATLGQIRQIIS